MSLLSLYNQGNRMNRSLQEFLPDHLLGKSCELTERRRKSRIYIPFLVRVRGVNTKGEVFEVHTAVENLSASGLYMALRHNVAPGRPLFVVLTLATYSAVEKPVARIALRSLVQRAEAAANGLYGIAIKFTKSRFL